MILQAYQSNELGKYSNINPSNHNPTQITQSYNDIVAKAREKKLVISPYTQIVTHERPYEYVVNNFAWESAAYYWTTQYNDAINPHKKTAHQIVMEGGSINEIINIINAYESDEAKHQRTINYELAYKIFVEGEY